MSIGSISDALSRVSAIQQQLQQLGNGAILDSALGVSGGSTSSTGSTSSDASTSARASSDTDFASALASAQSTDASAQSTDTATQAADTLAQASDASVADTGDSSVSPNTDLLSGGVALDGGSTTTSVLLPAQSSALLTSDQQQFASTLSADTGLSPSVVSAWLLAEESGGAAQTRQAAGDNDWLNVGYTDSATYGASDAVWSDPTTAANATAAWLQGQDSISGYGTASAGIQAILSSVGQAPSSQIEAIQNSGWSSSGYPSLGSLYEQVGAV